MQLLSSAALASLTLLVSNRLDNLQVLMPTSFAPILVHRHILPPLDLVYMWLINLNFVDGV